MATKKSKTPVHKMPDGSMMKGKMTDKMKKEMPMKPMKKGKC